METGTHIVIQSGHPITFLFCPIYMYVCVASLMSVSPTPCSVLPPREGGSRPFEVSLQLQGLTPQVRLDYLHKKRAILLESRAFAMNAKWVFILMDLISYQH